MVLTNQRKNYLQEGDFDMIQLFLEQHEKKYLEIFLDNLGCNCFIENLKHLKRDKIIILDLTNSSVLEGRYGFLNISHISFTYISTSHILNTEYNIRGSLLNQSTIEIGLTSLGIDEFLYIIKFVQSSGDHFHLFGSFNLYTGESETSPDNILNAMTIYKL